MDKPKSASVKLMEARVKSTEELRENFKKISTWISPFVRGNEEVEKAINNVRTGLMLLPVEDLLLYMTIQAEQSAMKDLFKTAEDLSNEKKRNV